MKYKNYMRILSLLLALVMMFELAPLSAVATASSSLMEPTDQEETLTVVGEVSQLRSEQEKHYRLSDGSYIVVDYGMPVHYARRKMGRLLGWTLITRFLPRPL